MNAAGDYRKLLLDARARQLELTQETVQRVDYIFTRTYRQLKHLLKNLPNEKGLSAEERELRRTYLRERIAEVQRLTANLNSDFGSILHAGMHGTAQAGADREASVLKLLGKPANPGLAPTLDKSWPLSDGKTLTVGFGEIPLGAIENTMKRVYKDGLKLSERMWNLTSDNEREIADRIMSALVTGRDAKTLAESLRHYLVDPNADNAFGRAHLLAQSEVNTAYKEATIQAALDPETGQMHEFLSGIRWSLSASHTQADICDILADDDTGLGPGVYLPMDVPSSHPRCMCWLADVLTDYPDVGLSPVKPRVDEVPDSQVAYYAEAGDPAAQRVMDSKAASPRQAIGVEEDA
jgi:hypothetical protein